MLELTWIAIDLLFAGIFLLCAKAIIPALANKLGFNIVFKIEKLSKKEILKELELEIKVKEANKRFLEGVK